MIEISVLLNDAEICTMPVGIFFRSFFLNVFFFGAALAIFLSSMFNVQCSKLSSKTWNFEPGTLNYFLPGAFFLATAALRGPLRVRALVDVRWPRTGKLRRWRKPR